MNVRINARDHYESWTVDTATATVFMEIYNSPENGFAAKHLLRSADESVCSTLESRNLKNVTTAEDLGDKMLSFNLKLKATKDEPKNKTNTNTMIDLSKINERTVALKFAEAIAAEVGIGGADGYYPTIDVELGTACVITDGKKTGTSTMIKIGGTKVGTSNKGGKTFLSFEVDHCSGT